MSPHAVADPTLDIVGGSGTGIADGSEVLTVENLAVVWQSPCD